MMGAVGSHGVLFRFFPDCRLGTGHRGSRWLDACYASQASCVLSLKRPRESAALPSPESWSVM